MCSQHFAALLPSVFFLLASTAQGQMAPPPTSVLAVPPPPAAAHTDHETTLPIRAVSLYTNGVAFFELAGQVHGDSLVRLDFTTQQLNDALASLSAVDLGGGRITGAGYATPANATPDILGLGPHPSDLELYRALKGRHITVRTGTAAISGRIVNAEQHSGSIRRKPPLPISTGSAPFPPQLSAVEQHIFLTLVTDNGAIRTVELTPSAEVRVLGSDALAINAYLDRLAGIATPDLRHVTLFAEAAAHNSAPRELHVSYLSQAPAWKSSYRIAFDGSGDAKLEGWAVVDNNTASDWKDVNLTLISGAPQSFIAQISHPLEFKRPQVPMPQPGEHPKQTLLPLQQQADPLGAAFAVSRSQTPGATGSGAVQVQASASGTTPFAGATTKSLDDLFEFQLIKPISIPRGQSATVPIFQTRLPVERVTVWQPQQKDHPARALYFKNTSGLTLDRGAVTVLEGAAFAGEGQMDLTHSGERQLVRYGLDESIEIRERRPWKQPEPYIRRYEISDGSLTVHRRAPEERDFDIRNTGAAPRSVLLQLHTTQRWNVDPSAQQPVEKINDLVRFEVPVDPGAETTFRFAESHSSPKIYKLADLSQEQIESILKESGNDTILAGILQPFLDTRKQLASIGKKLQLNDESSRLAQTEESRIRTNMSALTGRAGESPLAKRYAEEMAEQEARLQTLHHEKEDLLQQKHQLEDGLTARATGVTPATSKLRA